MFDFKVDSTIGFLIQTRTLLLSTCGNRHQSTTHKSRSSQQHLQKYLKHNFAVDVASSSESFSTNIHTYLAAITRIQDSMAHMSYQGIPRAQYISFYIILILNITWPFAEIYVEKTLLYFWMRILCNLKRSFTNDNRT
jgi:hypothetical protein